MFTFIDVLGKKYEVDFRKIFQIHTPVMFHCASMIGIDNEDGGTFYPSFEDAKVLIDRCNEGLDDAHKLVYIKDINERTKHFARRKN